MKYDYDADNECFVREDGLGKKFWINSSEALRIVTMRNLGYSLGMINRKIPFSSGKVSESTITNFLKNVEDGNIIVDGDYPAPKSQIEEMSMDMRISRLEEELEKFKERMDNPNPKSNIRAKVESWLKD
ncbi:hypothetical protein [Methanobrevibacter sp.]